MASPTRFPGGVGNVVKSNSLGMLGMLDPTKYHVYFNDFDVYTAADWTESATSVGAGTSAIAIADADGGIARITTAANENDGIFIESQGESFLVETGKKTWLKTRVALGNAIESDFIFGLHSTSATPQTATLRFLFESVDGSAAVYFNVDDNTTDVDSANLATFANDVFVTLGAYYDGQGNIDLFVNDAVVDQMTGVAVPGAEMAIGLGYLNGAAGAETTDVDYILVVKER